MGRGLRHHLRRRYRRWVPREPAGTVDLAIATPDGTATGRYTPVARPRGAVIMVGGSRGGTRGPAGVYAPLATRLQEAGIAALRLRYRRPNRLPPCVADVLAAIGAVGGRGIARVALLGWSFGGAVVIGAGAASDAVIGVATVAGQTYGTEAVGRLAPRPLLVLHGTADRTLPVRCAHDLYARAREPKDLVLYPGDDHGLTRHADQVLDTLYVWIGTLPW